MREHWGKDFAAIAALLLAAVWGTWLVARQSLELDASWTDGTKTFSTTSADEIRFAIWDDAAPLPGAVNEEGAETRPAVSPDGRFLVFASGERGLGADLWLAELIGGEPSEPRPLARINSAFDELAPAFGPDALYFASDRNGTRYGLDLWRVPYADGVFGEPEAVGPGVNTAADETDPYPVAGTRDLLFSSNRLRASRIDYDLYRASWDEVAATEEAEETAGEVEEAAAPDEVRYEYAIASLDELNTPWDERDPALSADGRTLLFASRRAGGRGGFDLYRSFDDGAGWLPATPLVGVNTHESERGPLPSRDGFTLLFDTEGHETASDLWRARSRELFRIPQPPLGLRDLLILALFVLMAILAWLAKRWRAIDVLYKCVLVSLLVHMFLMWYLRDVVPESAPVTVAGDERLFHVRLASAPSGEPASLQERGGELEAERAEPEDAGPPERASESVELAAAAPSEHAMEIAERGEETTPTRENAELEARRAETETETRVQEREAPAERYAAEAPALVHDPRADAPAAQSRPVVGTPRKSETERVLATEAAPETMTLAARRAPGEGELTEPNRARTERPETHAVLPHAAVAQPAETFARASGSAPALALPEVATIASPERSGTEPARVEGAPAVEPSREVSPLAEGLRGLAPASRPVRELDGPTRRERVGPSAPSEGPVIAMRETIESGDDLTTTAAPSEQFDPVAGLDSTLAATRPGPLASPTAPQRLESEATRGALARPGELATEVEAAPEESAPARRAEIGTPTSTPSVEVAMREMNEPELVRTTEPLPEPSRFDPTADLNVAREAAPARAPSEGPQPRRFEASPVSNAPARPERIELAAAAPPPEPIADDAPRLEHTPYQNRYGSEKLRALEEFGGGVETEAAVASGLSYLASVQHRRGWWGERADWDEYKYGDVRIGKTGLTLLAFLGAGHSPDSDTEYTDVTRRAVAWLLAEQHENGHVGDGSAYGHGIATYALAECYAITGQEELREPLERAVARILEAQATRDDERYFGGWGYYFHDGHVWDGDRWPRVSVTAWQVMALESARLGGLEVDDVVFTAAGTFLANAWDPRREAFRYSHDPSRLRSGYPILPASTPAAMFALSLMGIDLNSDELADARAFVLERAPRGYRYTSDDAFVERARGNLYFWYYGTLAMFRTGGTPWQRWNEAMKETLLMSQSDDGSWRPISTYADSAGDDDEERTYSTAMCVLTLEVYYRYFTPLLEVR